MMIQPDRLSALSMTRIERLEYNVTYRCCCCCRDCDHRSPYYLSDAEYAAELDLDRFSTWLTHLAKYCRVSEFVLVGGEPLLVANLADYARVVRHSGLSDRVILLSNGFLLKNHLENQDLWSSIDRLVVTFYPEIPLSSDLRKALSFLRKTGKIEIGLRFVRGFRIPFIDHPHSAQLTRFIAWVCPFPWHYRCHVLYEGMIGKCPRLPFIIHQLEKRDDPLAREAKNDFLHLETSVFSKEALDEYLSNRTAMTMCRFCLGGMGKYRSHRQLSALEKSNGHSGNLKGRDSLDPFKMAFEMFRTIWTRR